LLLAGIALLSLMLFGGVLTRANGAVNRRGAACSETVLRAMRNARSLVRLTQPDFREP
jgi:hypothetical protein